MAWIETVVCDVCGRAKQETNHWTLVVIGYVENAPDSIVFMPMEGRFAYHDPFPDKDLDVYHLCGKECSMLALSRHQDGQTFFKAKVDQNKEKVDGKEYNS